MSENWSNKEVEIIVADYFSMLKDEIAGISYGKTEHRRQIMPLLNNRTDGSIEYKYQNVSAVLVKLGLPFIYGYKPAWNYQHALFDQVLNYLNQNQSIEANFKVFANSVINGPPRIQLNFEKMEEAPPKNESSLVEEAEGLYINPIKTNYLEAEQNNIQLGTFGEEIVMGYERWRLLIAGKHSLSESIEWVAKTRGDGMGFDILSKNINGTDRYIEVKTTKLGKDAPIFFSRNEYNFSTRRFKDYFLYRVFNFTKDPRLFIVNGRYDDFCKLHPVKFKGVF